MATLPPYSELASQFSRAESLPQSSKSPLRLSQLLDDGDASAQAIESVVLQDPALTAGVLKAASSAMFGRARPCATVRDAVMVLGFRNLRAIAVALWTKALVTEGTHRSQMDRDRYAHNGAFVGNLAALILREAHANGQKSGWSPEELYAAGVLHHVGAGLLSLLRPEVFDPLYLVAQAKNIRLHQTFLMHYGHSLDELGASALRTMGLPDQFVLALEQLDTREVEAEHQIPLAALALARLTAETEGLGLEKVALAGDVRAEDAAALGLDEIDLPSLVHTARQAVIQSGIRTA